VLGGGNHDGGGQEGHRRCVAAAELVGPLVTDLEQLVKLDLLGSAELINDDMFLTAVTVLPAVVVLPVVGRVRIIALVSFMRFTEAGSTVEPDDVRHLGPELLSEVDFFKLEQSSAILVIEVRVGNSDVLNCYFTSKDRCAGFFQGGFMALAAGFAELFEVASFFFGVVEVFAGGAISDLQVAIAFGEEFAKLVIFGGPFTGIGLLIVTVDMRGTGFWANFVPHDEVGPVIVLVHGAEALVDVLVGDRVPIRRVQEKYELALAVTHCVIMSYLPREGKKSLMCNITRGNCLRRYKCRH